ncbi:hypothetical protein [Mycolicibacter hiberniae]|uniref:hypothetical protein n=1 Tax=Mycolicibacter hiberniae TaxID=29314 RepID=UPI000D6A7AF5|nr:hypothetical protein [Mycolicibacter hiberniae]MCV7087466.1 hypothetical protein [Mycolicibacter hiberniae]
MTVVALVVAVAAFARATPRPTYTAAEKAAAGEKLCNQYKLAGRAAHVETRADGDTALARISMVNGALILETAASDPAIDSKYREAARELADSYRTMAASGSIGGPDEYQDLINITNAKLSTMKSLCGD